MSFKNSRRRSLLRWSCIAAVLAALAAGLAIAGHRLPAVRQLAARVIPSLAEEDHAAAKLADTDHAGHDAHAEAKATDRDHEAESLQPAADPKHEEAAAGHQHEEAVADHKHDEAAAVSLSGAAQQNVGIRLAKVELAPFERTITVPAMVVERPGRSNVQVAAPLTGVVTRIWPMQGESVVPGQPLFDLRLTHEEVVESQSLFLQTAEELDVVQRETARLEKVAADGAVAGKAVLERKYEQQKLEASLRSLRQRLLLHGLSDEQVDGILAKRTLLSSMTVCVPVAGGDPKEADAARLLQVETLKVEQGQHVKAGELLGVLADYSELYVQGKAFEQDLPALDNATANDWPVTAVLGGRDRRRQAVPGLKIVSVSNTVEPDSRAISFYVQLPNKLIRDRRMADGRRFCGWQFKPGQRLEVLVPVERWKDRIVLPLDAVVQDGAESYVFEQNDGHFDRRPVRVEYRDQYSAVLANDGAVAPGKMVVVAGAYQVHLAMKNKSGGAPDPHAGHNH